jgi:HlyD family secretion protein
MGLPLQKQVEKQAPWIFVLSIAGVLGVTTAVYVRLQNHTISETPVKPAPVTAVVALGRIQPEGEVIKLSALNAQDSRVNKILVKEGDRVKANQVIAILQGIDRREADLRDAQTDVRLRQAELTKVQQGDAKKAQLAVQKATIARLEAQRQAEIQQRKAAIAYAQATLHEAQLTYQRRQSLAELGAISRADRDEAERNLSTSIATLSERRADLELTMTTLKTEIAQERSRLVELQEVRPVDLEIAVEQLEKAKIAVERKQADLEDAQVRSPIAGRILRINTRVGEQVNTSQGIVELARTNQMYVIAEVAENDIGKVYKQQQATITSEYGGFTGAIKGTVEQISWQIGRRALQELETSDSSSGSAASSDSSSPTTNRDARIVEVKIRIAAQDSPKVAALTNMQVRVKLALAKNYATQAK